VDAYNALVRKVAAQHPGSVSVYDLNKEFTTAKDLYTPSIDGYTVRTADGIHFTPAAENSRRAVSSRWSSPCPHIRQPEPHRQQNRAVQRGHTQEWHAKTRKELDLARQ